MTLYEAGSKKSHTPRNKVEWWLLEVGGGRNEELSCLTKMEFQFCKMKKLWRLVTHNSVNTVKFCYVNFTAINLK